MHECVYMYTPKFLITYLSKANNAAFSFVQLAFGGKGLSQCVKLKSGFVFLPTFLIGGFLLLLTPFPTISVGTPQSTYKRIHFWGMMLSFMSH